jgi:hypothetical protein
VKEGKEILYLLRSNRVKKTFSREGTPDNTFRGQASGSQRELKMKDIVSGFFFEFFAFFCGQYE